MKRAQFFSYLSFNNPGAVNEREAVNNAGLMQLKGTEKG